MEYRKLKLKDLEFEIDEKIILKDIFNNSLLTSKYMDILGIKYISNLDDYEVITSNLSNENKLMFIEKNMVLLKDKKSLNILLGVTDFKQDMDFFDKIQFDEIVFLDKNLVNNVFSGLLLQTKENYKYPKLNISLKKMNFKIYNLFVKNSKAFELLPLHFNKKSAILYISDFISYIYINKKIYEIKVSQENLINDINKNMSIIKYLFNTEENLLLINNSLNLDIKNILDIKSFNFPISYINRENFLKIYKEI